MAVRHLTEIQQREDGYAWSCTVCYEYGEDHHPTKAAARRAGQEHEADPGVDDEDLVTVGLLPEGGYEDDEDDDDVWGAEDR